MGSGASVSLTGDAVVAVAVFVSGVATLSLLHAGADALARSGPGAAAAMVENGFRLCLGGVRVCVCACRPFSNPSSGEREEQEEGFERALYGVDDTAAVVAVDVAVNVAPREI